MTFEWSLLYGFAIVCVMLYLYRDHGNFKLVLNQYEILGKQHLDLLRKLKELEEMQSTQRTTILAHRSTAEERTNELGIDVLALQRKQISLDRKLSYLKGAQDQRNADIGTIQKLGEQIKNFDKIGTA